MGTSTQNLQCYSRALYESLSPALALRWTPISLSPSTAIAAQRPRRGLGDSEGVATADVSHERSTAVRARLPILAQREAALKADPRLETVPTRR